MAGPEPTAAGTLAATPMQHLLVYALDRKLSGSIVLETPDGRRSALSVDAGVPTKAKTSEPVMHLGRLLLEMGAIDETLHNRTLVRVAKDKLLHGKLLLEEQAVDEDTLGSALREQVARKILWMATLPPDTLYGYYEGLNFLERWGAEPTPVQALALIWRAIRSFETPQRIEATLARLPKAELRLHAEAQPGRFGFAQKDAVVVDVLRAKPQPLRELLESEIADEASVKRVIYALAVTRHLELGTTSKPIGITGVVRDTDSALAGVRRPRRPTTGSRTAPKEEAPPAPTSAGETAPLRKELLDRAQSIPTENYYQILGVSPKATTAEIQAAFFELAKKWHPDRLGPDLKDLRDLTMRTFARITEAHQMLADPERRKDYDELLSQGGGTSEEQEQVQRVMRAITNYRKAEVLLKKRNFTEAAELAKSAHEDDPTQADYHALYAWIVAQTPERANGPFDDLIEILDQAVKQERSNERARFYRAQLLKRAGRNMDAIKDFRYIVERNPKHLDAVRELRLHEMRKSNPGIEQKPKPPPGGGLLNKFFKR